MVELLALSRRKEIAKAVSRYCREHGITHQAIADAVGISKSGVDKWFSSGNFSSKGILVLEEQFGVPSDLFYQDIVHVTYVLDFKDIKEKDRYTMMHELGHLAFLTKKMKDLGEENEQDNLTLTIQDAVPFAEAKE